jgi:hypothetical protein
MQQTVASSHNTDKKTMKKISLIFGGVLAAVLATGLQANATVTSQTFTETVNTYNAEIGGIGNTYWGSFAPSSLSPTFNWSQYSDITSISLDFQINNAPGPGTPAYLTLNQSSPTPWVSTTIPNSGQTDFNIAYSTAAGSSWQYIVNSLEYNDPITYGIYADCHLANAELVITAQSGGSTIPDGSSTMMLLGGVFTVAGLIKRKLA